MKASENVRDPFGEPGAVRDPGQSPEQSSRQLHSGAFGGLNRANLGGCLRIPRPGGLVDLNPSGLPIALGIHFQSLPSLLTTSHLSSLNSSHTSLSVSPAQGLTHTVPSAPNALPPHTCSSFKFS